MHITKNTYITKNSVWLDNQLLFSQDDTFAYQEFFKSAFKTLCAPYPKFYKMDSLSKLGFLVTEILLKDTDLLLRYAKEDIGLVFLNSSSTIITDTEHQQSINDRSNYFPSPAVFVYTLPNIMLGEICIKNGFFGENALLITEKFDATTLHTQIKLLTESCHIQACVAGWAEINEHHFEAFTMLIEPDDKAGNSKEKCTFAVENIQKLYTRKQ